MRNDLRQRMKQFVHDDIKPNFATLARQYNADYRTVKRVYEEAKNGINSEIKQTRPSLLDPYRSIIKDKVETGCSAKSIFKFIEKKGFKGKYTIVREYCSTLKGEQLSG